MVRTRACSANTWPTVLPGRNAASQDLERLGPGVEHVAVARVGLAGQDHIHHRRMVVPVRGGDLELYLVARRHRAVTGVVADEQRLLAGAHRPAAGARVA